MGDHRITSNSQLGIGIYLKSNTASTISDSLTGDKKINKNKAVDRNVFVIRNSF